MSAGIDLSTILSKKVGAFGLIAGSVLVAAAAAATSLIFARRRGTVNRKELILREAKQFNFVSI